ncbi:MAG: response regulator [Chloroflexi bacterium]|nr:response regulator [Chloroflexota bacterium]
MLDDQPNDPTVLIVDDSIEGSRSLAALLELEGATVLLAHNGQQALDIIFNRDDLDVVILDVMMPGMNGMEVLTVIRDNPDTAELPVIMMTALDETTDMVRGFELGATDYVTKPAQFEVLWARIRTQYKIKKLQDQILEDLRTVRQLNLMKDKFLQITAHDLKNPLSNIIMGIDVVDLAFQPTGAPIDHNEILDRMRVSARTMLNIINDFLDLQAMQSGKLRLRLRPMQLNDVAELVVKQYQAYADAKAIPIHLALAEDLPRVPGDYDRLSQVATNLVSNAIKFSTAGHPVIVRTLLGDDQYIRFEVEDNGPGIPEDEMPQLFTEFSRLTNQPTGGEKSSGVGLSISRHMIDLHGGQIGADSVLGQGSTFWFALPLGDVEAQTR